MAARAKTKAKTTRVTMTVKVPRVHLRKPKSPPGTRMRAVVPAKAVPKSHLEEAPDGFYWHVHHRVLVEWCWDAAGRRSYITTLKPKEERARRLRLLAPVKNPLPGAVATYKKTLESGGTDSSYTRRQNVYNRVMKSPEWEALHRVECKRCPWDGTTIFPVKKPAVKRPVKKKAS